jgi:acyl carrier protein
MSEVVETEPRVRSIVAVHLDVDPKRLKPDARLGEDLCVDSLAAIELAMVLEDEFDIALPEEVLGCVRTYGDMVNLVGEKVAGRAGSPACS